MIDFIPRSKSVCGKSFFKCQSNSGIAYVSRFETHIVLHDFLTVLDGLQNM